MCDEPTSALDVSVQAQILNLMMELQRDFGLAQPGGGLSHQHAGGRDVPRPLVEVAATDVLFRRPRHPYTRMLLDTIPDLEMTGRRRMPVAGEVPSPINPPSGCAFRPRCPFANERCKKERPEAARRPGGRQRGLPRGGRGTPAGRGAQLRGAVRVVDVRCEPQQQGTLAFAQWKTRRRIRCDNASITDMPRKLRLELSMCSLSYIYPAPSRRTLHHQTLQRKRGAPTQHSYLLLPILEKFLSQCLGDLARRKLRILQRRQGYIYAGTETNHPRARC